MVILRDWAKEGDKIKGAFAIARDLAQKVVDAEKSRKRPDTGPLPEGKAATKAVPAPRRR